MPLPHLRRPSANQLLRIAAAAAGGLAIATSFPGLNWWWAAVVGVALLTLALRGASGREGLLAGFVFGLTSFLPVLSWSGTYVGNFPWIALSVTEAIYLALMGCGVAVLQSRLQQRGLSTAAWFALPLCFVLQEWVRSTFPFGGFSWGRLAFSQADSPLLPLASVAGAPGLTATVAALGVLLAGTLVHFRDNRSVSVALLVSMPIVVGSAAAVPLDPSGPRTTVALIQGNVPTAGLDFNSQRRAVLDNHVKGTAKLAAQRPPHVSLVVWPENSSDIDPLKNADAAGQIQRAISAVNAPLLVGAVLDGPGDKVTNASLLYRGPDTPPEEYIKTHPVPFAEYIPYRSFFRFFSTKVDLVPRDFIAGDKTGNFVIDDPSGAVPQYTATPTICFEVAYDALVRKAVTSAKGPDLLVVQTNNATFGYTQEAEQQFAISRIRAVEHGRSVVHVSTVGVSGFIAPDGSVTGKTGLFTPAQVVGTPVVRSGLTIADRIGGAPDIAAAFGVLALAGLAIRRGRTPHDETARDDAQDAGVQSSRVSPAPREEVPAGAKARASSIRQRIPTTR